MVKTWESERRAEGEKNAVARDYEQYNKDWFDIAHASGIRYPAQLEKPPHLQIRGTRDPFAHLGRIGYRKNTWQFTGPGKDENNIYGWNQMKKTLWFEEMRRKVIAERFGIYAEIDESSVAGTGGAFYLREKRNKYLKVAPISLGWTTTTTTTTPTANPLSSIMTKSKV